MIFIGLSLLVVLAASGGLYLLWKKNGSPSMEEIQAKLEEAQQGSGAVGGAAGEEVAAGGGGASSRPVVATAPIRAGADTYAQYIKRTDVLTLVNYYSDT